MDAAFRLYDDRIILTVQVTFVRLSVSVADELAVLDVVAEAVTDEPAVLAAATVLASLRGEPAGAVWLDVALDELGVRDLAPV
jgi:hypothetical protein